MDAPIPKFSAFDIHDDIVYKNIQSVDIKAATLVPKTVKAGTKCPILVHWHGGGFMTGQRLFEPWFALWYVCSTYLLFARGIVVWRKYFTKGDPGLCNGQSQ